MTRFRLRATGLAGGTVHGTNCRQCPLIFEILTYAYDNTGDITGITDALWTGSRGFTYDALNRLTSASGTFGSGQSQVTHNYVYNAIGNILEKAGITYSYTNPLYPSAVTSTSDGKTYTYDANGNMVTGGIRTFDWDYDNRLDIVSASGGTVTSYYDYTGIRVKKTGNATTYFPFAGYQIENGVITKYIRTGTENLAAKKSTGETLFYHNDHLGGVNITTDANGYLEQIIEYDPWGKVSREEGIGDSLRRFTGKMLDPESGLYYYGGRYYDPELGRFISPDPFVAYPGDPQNLNRYSYVENNPVNKIDPSGYKSFWKKIGKFFKKIIGHIVGAIVTTFTGNPVLGGFVGGALNAALNRRNILVGAFTGGFVAGITGGLLGGDTGPPGAGGGFSFAGNDFPGGGTSALLATFVGVTAADLASSAAGRRRVSGGDDMVQSPNSLLMLASHHGRSGEFFRTGDEETIPAGMNPNVRRVPGPGPETPNPNSLNVTEDPSLNRCDSCIKQGQDPNQRFVCNATVCEPGGQPLPRHPNPDAPLSEKIGRTGGKIADQIIRFIFGGGKGEPDI